MIGAILVRVIGRAEGRSAAEIACQGVAACTSTSPWRSSTRKIRLSARKSIASPLRTASHSSSAEIGLLVAIALLLVKRDATLRRRARHGKAAVRGIEI